MQHIIYALVDPREPEEPRYIGVEKLNEREMWWIEYGFSRGWRLTNLTTGGDGSYTPQSAEFRRRRAEISTQIWASKKHTPETIEKLRALKTGVPRSEETKQKIREARALQAPHSPEARAKMSAAKKGKPPGTAGKPVSAETRAKMSEARKGRVVSAETRAKIAAAKKGRPRPDLVGRARPDVAERNRDRTGIARPDVAESNRQRTKAAAVDNSSEGEQP